MFKKHIVGAAVAVAALASAAPAMAVPIDRFHIDSPGHTYQVARTGTCVAGLAPGGNARLDWGENANGTAVTPTVEGDLCLQNTNDRVRLAVIYHDAGNQLLSRFSTTPGQGNGTPLNVFAFNDTGSQVASSAMDHVHLQMERDLGGGNWQAIAGASTVEFYP